MFHNIRSTNDCVCASGHLSSIQRDPGVRCQRPFRSCQCYARCASYASFKACAMSAIRSDGCSDADRQPDRGSRNAIFCRMSAGTPEWSCLRQAGKRLGAAQLTASLKICSAFKNLNAAAWPPTMSKRERGACAADCSRTHGRQGRPLRA